MRRRIGGTTGHRMALALSILVGSSLAAVFTSPKGYRITPPAGWRVDKSGLMGTDVVFLARPRDGFSANLNVLVTPAPPGATLEAGLKEIDQTLSRSLTGYKKISRGFTTLGGGRALYNTATHRMGTPPRTMRLYQVTALKNGKLYTFSCTSLESNHAMYDTQFTAALKSLRWTR